MTPQEIINKLPYQSPFLFVDEIHFVNTEGIEGSFLFQENMDFYRGHFKHLPITPGVILIETMAQIGLVSLGIFLFESSEEKDNNVNFGITSADIDFLFPVFPGEKVLVRSKKVYFRFGKLKCAVKMINEAGKIVCEGSISGMLISKEYGK